MKTVSLCLCLGLASVLWSCNASLKEETQPSSNMGPQAEQALPTKEPSMEEKVIWQQAQVRYLSFEGGFYGLVTRNGQKLLPLNLPKEFQQAGAIVKFTGSIEEGVMTIQQWGTPYKIKDIQLIKAGTTTPAKR